MDKIGLGDEEVGYFSDFCAQLEQQDEQADYDTDLLCAICLDILHEPHWLDPCEHVFCEPCLRRLSGARITKCPMCRQPIKACHPNAELADSIKQTFPGIYTSRDLAENRSNVRNYPLPPIRRSLTEILVEFQEEYLSNESLLLVMFVLMILMQFGIMMALHVICQHAIPPPEREEQQPFSWLMNSLLKIACCIFGFCRVRMAQRQTQRRPAIFLPLVRARVDLENLE